MKISQNGNNKKNIENLVVFILILIITVVVINYVWNGNKETTKVNNDISSKTKKLAEEDNTTSEVSSTDTLEEKLEKILTKIKGVGKVNVLITYSKSSEVMPMYSEDSNQKTTEETDKRRRKKNNYREYY